MLKSLLSDHVLVGDVNRKTFDGGYAPLHLAVVAGRVGCVEELLKCSRTESDITDFYGRTPLDYAEEYYRKDVAKLLRGNSKTPCVWYINMMQYVRPILPVNCVAALWPAILVNSLCITT